VTGRRTVASCASVSINGLVDPAAWPTAPGDEVADPCQRRPARTGTIEHGDLVRHLEADQRQCLVVQVRYVRAARGRPGRDRLPSRADGFEPTEIIREVHSVPASTREQALRHPVGVGEGAPQASCTASRASGRSRRARRPPAARARGWSPRTCDADDVLRSRPLHCGSWLVRRPRQASAHGRPRSRGGSGRQVAIRTPGLAGH